MKKETTNFKTTTAQFESEELSRYLRIWIFKALRTGPKTWEEIISAEGLSNQGITYIARQINYLIARCSVVESHHQVFCLPSDNDVNLR